MFSPRNQIDDRIETAFACTKKPHTTGRTLGARRREREATFLRKCTPVLTVVCGFCVRADAGKNSLSTRASKSEHQPF